MFYFAYKGVCPLLETILKAIILVSFIFCGYTLKRLGLFGRTAFATISTIVFNITLPAAIITHLNGIHFETRYLFISLLAIAFNVILVGVGYMAGKTKEEKVFYMLNMAGFNIGNFALPFVSYFFDSAAVLIVCIFDAGNSLMCLGGAYGMASMVHGQRGENIGKLLCKAILSSVPVLSYLVMIALSIASIQLPTLVIDWMKIPASANTLLSMMMIGVALGLSLKKQYLHLIYTDIGLRVGVSIALIAGTYFLLDYSMEIKRVIMILTFSPIAGMACFYTAKLKGKIDVAACINSCYILISVIIMSTMIVLLS